jgi:spermidine/putrescine transport system permease protein
MRGETRPVSPWLGIPAGAVLAFLHVPIALLMVFSFNQSRFTVWQGFSLHWYGELFADAQIAEATRNSIVIALAATFLATVIGTLGAYGMWKRREPWLSGSLYLSLATPEIVMGVGLLALFQGAFRFLGWQLGMHTVILAHVAFSVAYVAIVVYARLRTVDPELEEAAMDLGATEWGAFFRVTLPGLFPGIMAAALLALTISFDDYVITSLVAGVDSETLPMVMYAMARRGGTPVLNAVSTLVVVLFGTLILLADRLSGLTKRT